MSRQLGRQSAAAALARTWSAGMAPLMTKGHGGGGQAAGGDSSMDRPRSARVRLERPQAVEELVDEDVLALNQTGVGGLRRSPLVHLPVTRPLASGK